MTIGDRVRIDGSTVRVELVTFGKGRLAIGEGTYINYGTNVSSTASVSIGRNCLIGQYCIIMDDDYHSITDHNKPGLRAPIVIEDDVWLGARVIVLRGSRIGRGAVIGANSVVSGEIPPYAVALGSPARVHRLLKDDSDAID
jgi:maltose O-acetyltransferase